MPLAGAVPKSGSLAALSAVRSVASAAFASGAALKVMAGEMAVYFKTGSGATGPNGTVTLG